MEEQTFSFTLSMPPEGYSYCATADGVFVSKDGGPYERVEIELIEA